MTWFRNIAVPAVAAALAAEVGESVFVFTRPPQTINPPAFVVGRPTEVLYSTIAFGVDDVRLPVSCVGPIDGEEMVDDLIAVVRAAFIGDPTLGGAVQTCYPDAERGWRNLTIAGADLLIADVSLTIQM